MDKRRWLSETIISYKFIFEAKKKTDIVNVLVVSDNINPRQWITYKSRKRIPKTSISTPELFPQSWGGGAAQNSKVSCEASIVSICLFKPPEQSEKRKSSSRVTHPSLAVFSSILTPKKGTAGLWSQNENLFGRQHPESKHTPGSLTSFHIKSNISKISIEKSWGLFCDSCICSLRQNRGTNLRWRPFSLPSQLHILVSTQPEKRQRA